MTGSTWRPFRDSCGATTPPWSLSDGGYYLVGATLDELDDANAVQRAGMSLLERVNGLIVLRDPDFRSVSVAGVVKDLGTPQRASARLMARGSPCPASGRT